MIKIMDYIVARLQERSTWLGLIGLVSAFGLALSPEAAEAIITAGVGVAGAVAVFTKDKE